MDPSEELCLYGNLQAISVAQVEYPDETPASPIYCKKVLVWPHFFGKIPYTLDTKLSVVEPATMPSDWMEVATFLITTVKQKNNTNNSDLNGSTFW